MIAWDKWECLKYNYFVKSNSTCSFNSMIFCLSGFSFCFTALSDFFASEINQIMWRSQGCPIWERRNPVSVCCVCKITTRSILGELFPWGGLLLAVLIMIHCLFVCLCMFTMWTSHLWCNTVAPPVMATSPHLPPLQRPLFWWIVPTLTLLFKNSHFLGHAT